MGSNPTLSAILRPTLATLAAFFTELSRHAAAIEDEECADFEARIRTARKLMGGRDTVERFLQWTMPDETEPDDDVEAPNKD